MKIKVLYFLLGVCVVLAGCGMFKKQPAAIRIGSVVITASEFEEAFVASRFSQEGEAGRVAYLDTFISRKLILLAAEKEGVNKDPQFLQSVQGFWERALLKLMFDRKTKELAAAVTVSDKDIAEYYASRKDTEFAGKTYDEMYKQIQWLLLKQKQADVLGQWIDGLKAHTSISIDYSALGIKGR